MLRFRASSLVRRMQHWALARVFAGYASPATSIVALRQHRVFQKVDDGRAWTDEVHHAADNEKKKPVEEAGRVGRCVLPAFRFGLTGFR